MCSVAGDAVTAPGRPFGAAIQQHGLEAVDCGGKLRLGCLARLEFIPESAEFTRLVRWQKAEDPVGGDGFALVLGRHRPGVVGKRVTGVDLHEVVNDEHLEHAQNVELRPVRVLGERDDDETKVP